MAPLKRAFLVIILAAAAPRLAAAQNEGFQQFLQTLRQDAIAEGISPETANAALENVVFDDHVIELDQKQPENTVTFDDYYKRVVTPERVALGRELLQENSALLNRISARYNVQPEAIVALWGVESSYGRNSGDYTIVDSLASLAYEGRRAEFFRKELINALRIMDQNHIPYSAMRGSWAGAMGQCQFMPSTYLHFAVSYNNGNPDIWENTADVFASIANYISVNGWHGDETWGHEVSVHGYVPESEIGLDKKHSIPEWERRGIRTLSGKALPDRDMEASLVAPDGPDGRHFLVYGNFRALMRWNHSTYFAAAVGLLADRISYDR